MQIGSHSNNLQKSELKSEDDPSNNSEADHRTRNQI